MESDYLKDEMIKLTPVVDPNGSDSARLDNIRIPLNEWNATSSGNDDHDSRTLGK